MSKWQLALLGIVLFAGCISEKKCPESCDDGNFCTYDYCSAESNYTCAHTKLEGPQTGCSGDLNNCEIRICRAGSCVTESKTTPECQKTIEPQPNESILPLGVEENITHPSRELTIVSIWKDNYSHICLTIKNTGIVTHLPTEIKDMTLYINNRAYNFHSNNILNLLEPNDEIKICVCTTAEVKIPGNDCVGPTAMGYDYTGSIINVKIEPPLGMGSTYENWVG